MYLHGNTTIMVKDFAKAFDFYASTLGLDVAMRAGNDWAELTAPGLTIGLHAAIHGEPVGGGPGVTIGLQVENLDAAMDELKAKGVNFPHVIEADGRRFAYFNDPEGTTLYLAQLGR
jgi:catechol 2,3-dioxygenase-like lactoylglutathione lyase family enzyme